jgi:hypothetical protein
VAPKEGKRASEAGKLREENTLRSAVALRPAKSRKFDRATRDIIRDRAVFRFRFQVQGRESSRFQVVVEGQLQMTEENGLRVCVVSYIALVFSNLAYGILVRLRQFDRCWPIAEETYGRYGCPRLLTNCEDVGLLIG